MLHFHNIDFLNNIINFKQYIVSLVTITMSQKLF